MEAVQAYPCRPVAGRPEGMFPDEGDGSGKGNMPESRQEQPGGGPSGPFNTNVRAFIFQISKTDCHGSSLFSGERPFGGFGRAAIYA